ncbi:hypothetical protein MNEG_12356 [Monoraphidium neglectum]|uniref:Helicase C-terminal domain-containing protein n=1 Tax=Monoraphidium neglectum TaxID=145388 RepID=A0A0D2J747_9CHLO|nr:hypothetical protein MNEG_12356 [Monoraphidium neglectum]KIY95607.1 hypothetical protein MNEG_12356 [Monoraphidium neglectum]|eukprot:XP_013894627.1 hypothetical protein MNEG_12356 [Monoraphidium neglectum]
MASDPSARVLVFTQWSDLLDILAHALRRNGVAAAQARGRQGFVRAVEEFKAAAAADEEARRASGNAPRDEAGTAHEAAQEQRQAEGPRGDGEGVPPAPAPPASASARVLLLLVSQGGLGLNLTEAQHVVFAEPLLDPALEVQAIGRVHRLGQRRAAHVHRFLVEHTIEENVGALAAQRAAAMDMAAAAPSRGGASAAEAALTVHNVAALLSTNWGGGGGRG